MQNGLQYCYDLLILPLSSLSLFFSNKRILRCFFIHDQILYFVLIHIINDHGVILLVINHGHRLINSCLIALSSNG